MRRINKLSSYIYNRIAAGEVVERPSSVVKELVENSVDAGATEVSVYIFGGGTERITVIDNGSGIHSDDFELAFLPHATSKISTAEDLDDIQTLGFRGEALASIASISKVTLKSRTADFDTAYTADYDGMTMSSLRPSGGNIGTTITIDSLFYNTPARAKYLKKPKSEEQSITLLMTKLMLANPFVRFNYYSDNSLMLSTSGKGRESAIKSLYPKDIYSEILDINVTQGKYVLSGYILPNTVTRHNKNAQTLTVNGRIIVNSGISAAILKAYGEKLFTGQHPVYVLNLDIARDELDINVTPSKTDARFFSPDNLFSLFYHNVKNRLIQYEENKLLSIYNDLSTKNDCDVIERFGAIDSPFNHTLRNNGSNVSDTVKITNENTSSSSAGNIAFSSGSVVGEINIPNEDMIGGSSERKSSYKDIGNIDALKALYEGNTTGLSEGSNLLNILARGQNNANAQETYVNIKTNQSENLNFGEIAATVEDKKTYAASGLNVIGTCFNTYLLVSTDEKLYLVDIHAANERLLFDKLMNELKNKKVNIQPLLIPEIVQLEQDENDYLMKILDSLTKIGFEIDDFGGGSVKVNSVPQVLTGINIVAFIMEIIKNKNTELSMSDILTEKISMFACKNSIKAGMGLSTEQAIAMADKIFLSGKIPLTCPHGRPIIVEMTKGELERKFRR